MTPFARIVAGVALFVLLITAMGYLSSLRAGVEGFAAKQSYTYDGPCSGSCPKFMRSIQVGDHIWRKHEGVGVTDVGSRTNLFTKTSYTTIPLSTDSDDKKFLDMGSELTPIYRIFMPSYTSLENGFTKYFVFRAPFRRIEYLTYGSTDNFNINLYAYDYMVIWPFQFDGVNGDHHDNRSPFRPLAFNVHSNQRVVLVMSLKKTRVDESGYPIFDMQLDLCTEGLTASLPSHPTEVPGWWKENHREVDTSYWIGPRVDHVVNQDIHLYATGLNDGYLDVAAHRKLRDDLVEKYLNGGSISPDPLTHELRFSDEIGDGLSYSEDRGKKYITIQSQTYEVEDPRTYLSDTIGAAMIGNLTSDDKYVAMPRDNESIDSLNTVRSHGTDMTAVFTDEPTDVLYEKVDPSSSKAALFQDAEVRLKDRVIVPAYSGRYSEYEDGTEMPFFLPRDAPTERTLRAR